MVSLDQQTSKPEQHEERAAIVWTFEEIFDVPVGHSLRLVPSGPEVRAGKGPRRWEHEEYDTNGRLVAVYESWPREGACPAFVKYSPHGWVLSISGRSLRHAPQRVRIQRVGTASP